MHDIFEEAYPTINIGVAVTCNEDFAPTEHFEHERTEQVEVMAESGAVKGSWSR